MYNKYIVLKKTGAALPSRRSRAEQRDLLKEKGQSLKPRRTLFIIGVALFPNPLALPCVKRPIFGNPVFSPTQTESKKENFPNSETQYPRITK